MTRVGHTRASLAAAAPMPNGDEASSDDSLLPEQVEQCRHESCTITDQRRDEPDVVVVLAECQDCPAVVSWRSTPGRGGERIGVQVEDVRGEA